MACVAAELQRTVAGGRVQQVIALDDNSIGMELYAQQQRANLLLSADPKRSRVYLTQEKLRRGVEQPSPLLLLLRKYVRGSQLTTVAQPDPTERVLFLHFAHPEHGATRLVVELIGQRSNLILLNQQGRILDCVRRVWAGETVQRPVMPGQPYEPPPAQEKRAPLPDANGMSATQLAILRQSGGPLWRLLVSHFAGVSPTLAREVTWRATGRIDTPAGTADATTVLNTLHAFWTLPETGQWQPGLWFEQGNPAGFAAYEVHGRGPFHAGTSISHALESYYAAAQADHADSATAQGSPPEAALAEHSVGDSYAALRGTVADQLRHAEARLQRQLAALAGDEPAPGEAAQLRVQAEWLLALNSQIEPGQQTLTIDLGEQTLVIPLQEGKSAIDQAEQMFTRAAKLERAAQIIPERRAKLADDLDYLAQLTLDLANAENQPEIAAIQRELQTMGLLSKTGKAGGPLPKRAGGPVSSQPLRYYSPQGFEIVVGRNARQNEQVTFDLAKGEDLWLHARGAPGAHVVIRSGGQAVSAETLRMAAQLAAYYSKLVGERVATVIVTPRRFISRAPGGRPGQVLVRQEETITVPALLPVEST
jgi:predicted ribosome quality control (RQC) complex YloA/Tae2 family protein